MISNYLELILEVNFGQLSPILYSDASNGILSKCICKLHQTYIVVWRVPFSVCAVRNTFRTLFRTLAGFCAFVASSCEHLCVRAITTHVFAININYYVYYDNTRTF